MPYFLISAGFTACILYVTARFWFSDFRNRQMSNYFVMGLIVAGWTFSSGLSTIIDKSHYPFFYTLTLSFVCALPYSILWFFLSFTKSPLVQSKLLRRTITVVPLLDILAAWTNPLHRLYFTDYSFLKPSKGPLFWVHTVIAYTVILIGAICFFPYLFKTFKRNIPVLVSGLGFFAPWAVNIMFTLDVFPFQMNLTPQVFCTAFFCFFFFSYSSHLFSFRHALLTRIFEFYQDGIMLVDRQGLIIDYNAGIFGNFTGITLAPQETRFTDFVGYLEKHALRQNPPDFFESLKTAFSGGEFTVDLEGKERTFLVKRQLLTWEDVPVIIFKKNVIGYAISFTDITGEKEQNNRLLELKIAAEAASEAKSNFLANTSHEIRTPLNAILGMAELIIRRNALPSKEARSSDYDDAQNIKQAGSSLLAVINDILDFSKIESGKLEFVQQDYRFTELLSECISIIQVRIGEKHIRFLANIDSALPDQLAGDPVRLRQILLNILNNAVKYTAEGFIRLSVWGELDLNYVGEDSRIVLHFKIEDSGVGIKPENIERLFSDFARFDSHRNRGIEGTGLGLAISRNLARIMDGEITVESVYGKGSSFEVILPQIVRNTSPLARVMEPQNKTALLYERRSLYGESIYWSFKNLGVPVKVVKAEEVQEELASGNWAFIFVSPDAGKWTLDFIREHNLNTLMVLLTKQEESEIYLYTPKITIPTFTASLADVLNGKIYKTRPAPGKERFTAPAARVLVVDDIATNLMVARGLLAVYKMQVDVCPGGREAVEMAEQCVYDIIFMDHMMPEMDGMEAAAAIRAREIGGSKTAVPIVALSANAVRGAEDLFREKGFNDFIAKPIDVRQLDEVLERWLPPEKLIWLSSPEDDSDEEAAADTTTPGAGDSPEGSKVWEIRERPEQSRWSPLELIGVNVQKGIVLTGGSENGYARVLLVLRRDIRERLVLLAGIPDEAALPAFIIQVHALKSASRTVGAEAVSLLAQELETAGKIGDLAAVKEKLPPFRKKLEILESALSEVLRPSGEGNEPEEGERKIDIEEAASHRAKLEELKIDLQEEKIGAVDAILKELEALNFDEKTRSLIEEISDAVLVSEFSLAAELLEKLLV